MSETTKTIYDPFNDTFPSDGKEVTGATTGDGYFVFINEDGVPMIGPNNDEGIIYQTDLERIEGQGYY